MKDRVKALLESYAKRSLNLGEGMSFMLYFLAVLIVFTFIMSVFSPLVSAILTGRLAGVFSSPEAIFSNGLYLAIAAVFHELGHRQTARHYGLKEARFRAFLFHGTVDCKSNAVEVAKVESIASNLSLVSLTRITATGLILTLMAAATAIFLGLYYKPLLIGAATLGFLGIENLFPRRESDGGVLYLVRRQVWGALFLLSLAVILTPSVLLLIG